MLYNEPGHGCRYKYSEPGHGLQLASVDQGQPTYWLSPGPGKHLALTLFLWLLAQ